METPKIKTANEFLEKVKLEMQEAGVQGIIIVHTKANTWSSAWTNMGDGQAFDALKAIIKSIKEKL